MHGVTDHRLIITTESFNVDLHPQEKRDHLSFVRDVFN